tara:strand:+ start:344 stop:532 length:189 start_codon:yes stop_codon:yes gene_type:complete
MVNPHCELKRGSIQKRKTTTTTTKNTTKPKHKDIPQKVPILNIHNNTNIKNKPSKNKYKNNY